MAIWFDEFQGDEVRDPVQEARYAEKAAAEREAERSGDEVLMAGMNRADRRRYARKGRWW